MNKLWVALLLPLILTSFTSCGNRDDSGDPSGNRKISKADRAAAAKDNEAKANDKSIGQKAHP